MLKLSKSLNINARRCSNIASRIILEPLKNRGLLQVKGNETKEFLQGLITNDLAHLSEGTSGSMYTLFLNTKGRVLFDAVVYKTDNSDVYLIECDTKIEEQLMKHLRMYRVRKKIDIVSLNNEYKMHVLFKSDSIRKTREQSEYNTELDLPLKSTLIKKGNDILIFKDPRITDLGCRIISKLDVKLEKDLSVSTQISSPNCSENYKVLRYSLGVGEGVEDLPVGNCFPLESNCDYLHGISFHKGCYLGQELTARTHHTGVTRKRLMPLLFERAPSLLPNENTIKINKINLGKLRGIEQNLGLALLKIETALEIREFKVGDELAKVWRPHWWPLELPKEKFGAQKT
ncbi:putative transferase CAF17 homolog, mitochondrial [Diorhabda carinulata]|uniref:putative transferase CAF17 homolog, mitochondrial n=1 Tax=Diorhabda carinulata TaxID=1163345 RepID=UPI0025A2524F|nr:putative transferase CAF17 homolog, mitochondrial [Diorhabda carinulata]